VYLGSIRSGVLAALADGRRAWAVAPMSVGIRGPCSGKPVDVAGRSAGYTYSDLQESRQARPVTDSDLVDANGSCPAAAAPGSDASAPSEGVGLGMTECEVVAAPARRTASSSAGIPTAIAPRS